MSTKVRKKNQSSFAFIPNARGQIRAMIRDQLRDATLNLIQELFLEEVESLCGPAFSRKGDTSAHRGGWDPGSVILEDQRMEVKKPRVKKAGKEVELESYQALQGYDLLQERVLKHMMNGVSTRSYEPLLDDISGGLGLKKSTVSKAFTRSSRNALDQLNGRDLSGYRWLAVMIDGIEFAGSSVVVALGITLEGEKLILGLKRGESEDSEVCKDLLQELIERNLKSDEPFLFVLDGSKALKKAVRKVFGDRFPIQRCVRHKERNILKYLQKQYHAEFRRRWKLLHGITRFDEAKLEYDRLLHWLMQKNLGAAASLQEADMETLTVIQLQAGPKLRKTLLSTNPIESVFDKVRYRSSRVKHWRKDKDQIERWAGSALIAGEKGFRSIRGRDEIHSFLNEVTKFNLLSQNEVA
jgi:putative transposase